MRAYILIAVVIGLSGSSVADEHDYSHEQKTYRFGGTYEVVSAGDAQACANVCQSDEACKAWSFQRETDGMGAARCELKNTIGKAEENALMVSGISPRLADIGNAPKIEDSENQLLGGTRAGVSIPTLRPIITSANATVTISGVFDSSATAGQSRLP